MDIYPAIDLLGGKVVRLEQGRRDSAKIYSDRPADMARTFARAGAARIHVVDLDAALSSGREHNRAAIAAIAAAASDVGAAIEAGGGVRGDADCEALLALGVRAVVLGTAAVKDRAWAEAACRRFAGRIVVAVDARDGKIAVEGWTSDTGADALAVARAFAQAGAAAILHTDIARDGMRAGPNLEATRRLVEGARPCPVIASGGVARLSDIDAVRATGAAALVVGKAIYEGAFSVSDAVARAGAGTP